MRTGQVRQQAQAATVFLRVGQTMQATHLADGSRFEHSKDAALPSQGFQYIEPMTTEPKFVDDVKSLTVVPDVCPSPTHPRSHSHDAFNHTIVLGFFEFPTCL